MNDDIHSYGLHAILSGMDAAATRFSRRMDEINAKRHEIKRSDYYLNYTMTLARQVDDLTEVLWKHQDRLKAIDRKFDALTQKIRNLEKEKNEYMNYVGEVWMEFDRIENDHQKSSCMQFAFRKVFLDFMKNTMSKDDIEQNLDEILEKVNASIFSCYKQLMEECNFKSSMPASRIHSLQLVEKHVRKLQGIQKDKKQSRVE